MGTEEAILSAETFRFFRDLGRNNSKAWMDENRDRYKQHVVEPFRRLLDALAPGVQKLHPGFSHQRAHGARISRASIAIFDLRKTKHRTTPTCIFSFSGAETPGRAGGQLYVGLSAEAVTSVSACITRAARAPWLACACRGRSKISTWLARQQKKFARKYDSYWYASEKGKWTKRSGWPRDAQEWKKAKGWIVRRKLRPAAALRPAFRREVEKTFRELFPLYCFGCLQKWKS